MKRRSDEEISAPLYEPLYAVSTAALQAWTKPDAALCAARCA